MVANANLSISLVFRWANRALVYLITVMESVAIGLVTLWTCSRLAGTVLVYSVMRAIAK